MPDFQLEPDRGLVSPAELANLVAKEEARRTGQPVNPPTDQTIRNYVRRGVVEPAETTPGGRMLFDPAVAVDAVLANRPERRHGGRRRGSGRKKNTPRPAPAFRVAADAAAALEEIRERAEKGTKPRDAVPHEHLFNLTHEQLRVLVAYADHVGLTVTCLDRLKRGLEIQALERKEAVEAGKLIVADDMLAAWNDTLRAIVHAVEALPARLVDRVLPLAYPSREVADALIGRLHAAGTEPELLDAVREALSVPPGLGNLLRAAMADEVHDFRQRVAETHGGEGGVS